MKYAIFICFLLNGCTMKAGEPVRDAYGDTDLERVYDIKHNVVCYKYINNRTGLSCVKLP